MNFISEAELRSQLKISRSTLYRYKNYLGMPHYKVGAKTFFNLDEVVRFIESYSSHHKTENYDRKRR